MSKNLQKFKKSQQANSNIKNKSREQIVGANTQLGQLSNWVLVFFLFLIPLICSRFFQDHFTVIKWHLTHTLAAILLMYIFFQKKVVWPKLGNLELFLAMTVGFISIGNVFYLRFYDFHGPLLDRLSFLAFLYVFYFKFQSKEWKLQNFIKPILLATLFIHIYAFFEMVTPMSAHLYPYMAGVKASSLFGNTNMTAQFLGISLIFQMYVVFFIEKRKEKSSPFNPWKKWSMVALLSFTLAYINYLACRSVMLALLIPLTGMIYYWKIWQQKVLASVTVGLTLIFMLAINNFRGNEDNLFSKSYSEMQREGTDNQNSMYLRLSLWESAIKLILKHPTGIGTANTEFNLVPYQVGTKVPADEKVVYNTPHNEYLRYLIEDGAMYTFMMLALLFLILKKFIKLNFLQNTNPNEEHLLILGLCFYLEVESFFQFPLLNAYPFIIYAMILAYLLVKIYPHQEKKIPWAPPLFSGLCFIIVAYLTWADVVATYNIANLFKEREKMEEACSIFPSRWRACLHLAQIQIEEGKLKDADKTLNQFLIQSPYHFVAIRLMGINQFKMGNLAKGCFYFYQYDKLFESKSSVHQDLVHHCPTITPEFEKHHPFP